VRSRPRLLLALLLGSAVGCGSKGDLSGNVSFQGKPVRIGSVQVVGSDGIPRTCPLRDGAYSFRSLGVGKVKLAVSSPDPGQAVRTDKRKLPGAAPEPSPATPDRGGWFALPAKYASFETSELACEVKAGANRFDADLK
jgi:hypothetical protein